MSGKKIALCIGNNNYNSVTSLSNAINDAHAIGLKLQSLGFEVLIHDDLNAYSMACAIGDSVDKLSNGDVFVFYYAGHGCQIENSNYLVPVDAVYNDNDNPHGFAHTCISLSNNLMEPLKNYPQAIKIIILDACREIIGNSRSIGANTGFLPISSPVNSIIALSTSPGTYASDEGMDNHSLYTSTLLRYIDMPHVNIETIFKRVRQDMVAENKGKQIPWEHTSLVEDFKFNPHYSIDGMSYEKSVFTPDYRCTSEKARTIVSELKNGDYVIENNAVNKLHVIKDDEFSADELFYFGRSIFYAAVAGNGPSFNAQAYIRDLDSKSSISVAIKEHLLNGMAYESYFGENGNLQSTFCFREKREIRLYVFDYLEKDSYKNCRYFIANYLASIKDRPVFIPGDERIQFFISVADDFTIKNVYHRGKPILSYMNERFFDEKLRWLLKEYSELQLKEKFAIALNTRGSCIDLVFDRPIVKNQLFKFSSIDFDLIY